MLIKNKPFFISFYLKFIYIFIYLLFLKFNFFDAFARLHYDDTIINLFSFLWTNFWYLNFFFFIFLFFFFFFFFLINILFFIFLFFYFYEIIDFSSNNLFAIFFNKNSTPNILLFNNINKYHPFIFYSAVIFYLLIFFKLQLNVVKKHFIFNWEVYVIFLNWIVFIFFNFSFTALFLGCWWALQEGTWGGWWNWDPSEIFGFNLLITALYLMHNQLSIFKLFKFFYFLTTFIFIFILFYACLQLNFDLISHNFGIKFFFFFNNTIFLLETSVICLLFVSHFWKFFNFFFFNFFMFKLLIYRNVTYVFCYSILFYFILFFIFLNSFYNLLNFFIFFFNNINIFNYIEIYFYNKTNIYLILIFFLLLINNFIIIHILFLCWYVIMYNYVFSLYLMIFFTFNFLHLIHWIFFVFFLIHFLLIDSQFSINIYKNYNFKIIFLNSIFVFFFSNFVLNNWILEITQYAQNFYFLWISNLIIKITSPLILICNFIFIQNQNTLFNILLNYHFSLYYLIIIEMTFLNNISLFLILFLLLLKILFLITSTPFF